MDPPFYVLSSGDDTSSYGGTPNTSQSASLHDTSRARYHIEDIGAFAADLNDAAKSAFPNRGRSRYTSVNACLIRWEEDELQVQNELGRLDIMFQDYGFSTNTWHIPSRNSHLELMSKSIDFIRALDGDQNLFVIYYAGHGRINEAWQAEWTCKSRDPNSASGDWSATQSLFAKAKSDVLILLDTCAAASSTMRSQYGVMEAIVACGFESKAPPPGEHSFTNTLIEVLDDWIKKPSFSASCLHAEILFQLKLKETRKGREGIKLEWCVTPIHINYSRDSKAPAIKLARRNTLTSLPAISDPTLRPSTYVDAMDIDFDESNPIPTQISNVTSSGEFQTPHVLIKVGLEHDHPPLDTEQCLRWLKSIPLLAKWAKIEGVYPSYSTLIILSIPVSIWNMMPDHPACSFVGYISAPNLANSTKTDQTNDSTIPLILALTDISSTISPQQRVACIICKEQNLKCDGSKPSCGRCRKLQHGCAYDEARWTSILKRRYVKALEELLKSDETLASKPIPEGISRSHNDTDESQNNDSLLSFSSYRLPPSYAQNHWDITYAVRYDTAMKNIAFIVMILLPWASIASIFSTSVFNFPFPSKFASNDNAKVGLFISLSADLYFTTGWTHAALSSSRPYDFIVKTAQSGLQILPLVGPPISIAFLGLFTMSPMSSGVLVFVFVIIFMAVVSAITEAKVHDILLATAAYAAVLVTFLSSSSRDIGTPSTLDGMA